VRGHPHPEQLVRAQPERVQHRRVDPVQRSSRALLDHRVVPPAQPQRPVRELRGEPGVPAPDAALAQQRREDEVRVGVRLGHGAQHVERRRPGRVAGAPPLGRRGRGAGPGTATPGAAALRAAGLPPRTAAPPLATAAGLAAAPPLATAAGLAATPPLATAAGLAAAPRTATRTAARAGA
jgi:hypothetical protein